MQKKIKKYVRIKPKQINMKVLIHECLAILFVVSFKHD